MLRLHLVDTGVNVDHHLPRRRRDLSLGDAYQVVQQPVRLGYVPSRPIADARLLQIHLCDPAIELVRLTAGARVPSHKAWGDRGRVNHDHLAVDLVEPSGMPAMVRVSWPLKPTIVDPPRFGDTAAALVKMFSEAHVALAAIRARRSL
jgi:hypothetical protein